MYNSGMTKKKENEEGVEEGVTNAKATSATVYSSTGAVIRTYTLADHGEDFADLAKEMQAQHKDSKITLA